MKVLFRCQHSSNPSPHACLFSTIARHDLYSRDGEKDMTTRADVVVLVSNLTILARDR